MQIVTTDVFKPSYNPVTRILRHLRTKTPSKDRFTQLGKLRSNVMHKKIVCNRFKKSVFPLEFYLLTAILLMFMTVLSGMAENKIQSVSKPFRVFDKKPEHKNHLYNNSDWSHDGKKIALMVHDLDAANTATIWVYDLDTQALTQITYPDDIGMMDWHPVWSPDDTQIAFASNRDKSVHIWVVDADGQNMRKVSPEMQSDNAVAIRPEWTSDGKSLVFTDFLEGSADIFQMHLIDNSIIRLTDDAHNNSWPSYSPDGKYISYKSNRSGKEEIWLIDNASGEKEKLTEGIGPFYGTGSWSPDSQWIAVNAGIPNGVGWAVQVVVISALTGKKYFVEAPQINQTVYSAWSPSWSADGHSILYSSMPRMNFDSNLRLLDLITEKVISLKYSFVGSRGQGDRISWSPDSKRIAYSSRKASAGQEVSQDFITLTSIEEDTYNDATFLGKSPDWSPNGSNIVFISTGLDGDSLAFYEIGTERSTFIKTKYEGTKYRPRFSPDGELIAYFNRYEQNSDLWVYDTIAKDHIQLTFDGGSKGDITWSPDSENIAYHHRNRDTNSFSIWSVPAYGGKSQPITSNQHHDVHPLWGEHDSIFYSSQRNSMWEIWETNLEGNESDVLRPLIDITSQWWPRLILRRNTSHFYCELGSFQNRAIYVSEVGKENHKKLTKDEGAVQWARSSPDATKIAYIERVMDPWDQGMLWIADVSGLYEEVTVP